MSPDGQIVTFRRLADMVSSFASRLSTYGIRAGDCVIPMTDNSVIRAALSLALLRLGADVAMPQSVTALAKAGIKVEAVVRLADQSTDGDVRSIIFTQDWLGNAPTPTPAALIEGHIIFGTSGSTGLPKFIRFRADRLLHTVRHHVEGSGVSLGPVLVGIPETTMFGFYLMLRAFLQGHAIMWMRGDAFTMLEHAARLNVREFMMTPPALADLVAAVEAGAPKGQVARISIFGAITSNGLFERAEVAFGASIAIKLGSSETGQTSFGTITSKDYVPGWSGKPISTVEVRIVDPSPEGSGQMLIRAVPHIGSEGYLGGEAMLDADGWFDSGDVGRVLPDGTLMIEGRADNLINLGGSKFAAELIEMLASSSPGVRAVVAVRLPEAAAGRAELGLTVVAEDGFEPEALRVLLALKLKTRAPIVVRQVASIPRLPTGKVDRAAVKALFA
jgi:acyl-coenzyme A synthetase/AMP-(fatty) acid ligase